MLNTGYFGSTAFAWAYRGYNELRLTISAVAVWETGEQEAERAWDASFARSQDFLAQLADEALADQRAGRTELLDPDTL
jgi:hypothetical protein